MPEKPIVCAYATLGPSRHFYVEELRALRESALAAGYEFDSMTLPDLGSWARNTSQKPYAIISMLKKHRRPMLWLDADATVKKPLPFLEQTSAELSCVLYPAEKIRPGMEAMRYLPEVQRAGAMWQSGVLYLRPTEPVFGLLHGWLGRCLERPSTWDQIHLQREAARRFLEFEPFPQSYRVGGEYLGHDSAFHRHAKPEVWRRVLVLGSSRALNDYCGVLSTYADAGLWIAAVNNAWLVARAEMNFWFHSTDFDAGRGRPEGDHFEENPRWQCQSPHWEKEIRVLMVDVLNHLLNCAIADNRPLEVLVAASDFHYPDDRATHFYGTGGRDPLRFGDAALSAALRRVRQNYESAGCRVLRVQPFEPSPTMLPFDDVADHEILNGGAPWDRRS